MIDFTSLEKSILSFVETSKSLNKFAVYFEEEIVEGMAKALWGDWWSSNEEESGKNLSGKNILEVMPDPPPNAYHKANELKESYERLNAKSMEELFMAACIADDKESDPEEFGHYLAMMSLGSGVSWFDDHKKFDLKVPRIEYYYQWEPGDDIWNADDEQTKKETEEKNSKKLRYPDHKWHSKKRSVPVLPTDKNWQEYRKYLFPDKHKTNF